MFRPVPALWPTRVPNTRTTKRETRRWPCSRASSRRVPCSSPPTRRRGAMTNPEPYSESEPAADLTTADSAVASGITWPDDEVVATDDRAGLRSPGSAAVPVLLLVAGRDALWGASRMTWVRCTPPTASESREPTSHPGHLAGALTPLALVLLAAVAASSRARAGSLGAGLVDRGWSAAAAAIPARSTAHPAREHRRFGPPPSPNFRPGPGRRRPTHRSSRRSLTLSARSWPSSAGVSIPGAETAARISAKYDDPVFRRAAAAEEVAGRTARTPPRRAPQPSRTRRRTRGSCRSA